MNMLEFTDRELLAVAVADVIADDLRAAIAGQGAASLAVPGGSTPGPVFDNLARADLDWSKVAIMPGDERWVPETSPHSNAAQIRARLLQGRAEAAQFVPLFDGRAGDPGAIAGPVYATAPYLPLTVALLGMGGDMHTASLFPGDPVLAGGGIAPFHYVPVPGLDPRVPRMTLTPSAINAAARKYLVIFGSGKRDALTEALASADPVQAPVLAVASDLQVYWAE